MNSLPTSPALLVLAAGMGSRYGGLKQLDPVGPGGETVLDYSVFDAIRAGFTKIIFVIRRDFEAAFRERIGRRFESRVEIRYVFQDVLRLPAGCITASTREKPWGTGHAVWCAADQLKEPFAVINADDFYGADSFRQLYGFLHSLRSAGKYCMIGYSLANTLSLHGTVSRGLCEVDAHGFLRALEECTAIERQPAGARQVGVDNVVRRFVGTETVSMNCWGFGPDILGLLEKKLAAFLRQQAAGQELEFYLPSAVADMIKEDAVAVKVLPTREVWFGVTYQEDRPQVVHALQQLIRAGQYPECLWS